MKTIKLMIVDDHKLVREAISLLLKNQPNISAIGEAASGEEAIILAKEKKPDIILMDIKMPGVGGIHAASKIIASNSKIKIIALTSCDSDPFPRCMIKLGAKGYLTKGANLDKLLEAINRVSTDKTYLDPKVAHKLALKNVPGTPPGIFDSLSGREVTVMMMIANGIKVDAIAEKLCLSPKTINSCRYRIYEKLNLENDVQIASLALQHGFVDQHAVL